MSKHYKGIIGTYLTWNPHGHYCGIFPPTPGETEDGLDLEGEGWSGSPRCWFIKQQQAELFLHSLGTGSWSCLKDAEVGAAFQLTSAGHRRGTHHLGELLHSRTALSHHTPQLGLGFSSRDFGFWSRGFGLAASLHQERNKLTRMVKVGTVPKELPLVFLLMFYFVNLFFKYRLSENLN